VGFLLRSPYSVVVYQKHWALSRLRGEGSTRRHRHLPLWRNSSVAGLYPAGVSANLTGGSIGVAYTDSLGVHALVSRASLLQSDLPVQIRRPEGHRRGDSYVVPEHHSDFWRTSQWFLENITVAWAFSSRLGERRAGSAEEAGASPARSTNGLLAQMGERLHRTQEVGGSRPPRSTISTCSSTSGAPGSRPGGCRGGACQVDQSNTAL